MGCADNITTEVCGYVYEVCHEIYDSATTGSMAICFSLVLDMQ